MERWRIDLQKTVFIAEKLEDLSSKMASSFLDFPTDFFARKKQKSFFPGDFSLRLIEEASRVFLREPAGR